jgi:hypothetical protein
LVDVNPTIGLDAMTIYDPFIFGQYASKKKKKFFLYDAHQEYLIQPFDQQYS